MKQVLIIDALPLFREFFREKLIAEKLKIELASLRRDAFTKMASLLPDLVVIDVPADLQVLVDFLEKKQINPNTNSIPVFLIGYELAGDQKALLIPFKTTKYFTKPIKFDVFFEKIGKILRIPLSIDTTACVLETHLNDNVIFIEITQGLNREKLSLLKYKISEIIDCNSLHEPKIVLMMSGLHLGFTDGVNLEMLLDNIIADERIKRKHIKILSMDPFTRSFVEGHQEYKDVEVAGSLATVLNGVVAGGDDANIADIITERILNATEEAAEGSVEMRFYFETGIFDTSEKSAGAPNIAAAIVSDDSAIRQFLQTAFETINIVSESFDSGTEFLAAANKKNYNIIILDLFMPGISAFDILISLHNRQYASPVIVYSNSIHKASVMQALGLGAKGYLTKPLTSESVIQKVIEVLRT